MILMTGCLLVSCSVSRRGVGQSSLPKGDDTHALELVEYLWGYKDSHPDGFTLQLGTMTAPSEGISAAYYSTVTGNTPEELEMIVSHSLSHAGYIGGWLDSRDSTYFFDSVKIFPEEKLRKAVRFAKKNRQAAIYNLSKGVEIWVGADDKSVSGQ